MRKRTRGVVDVHLIVSEADRWVKPFAEAGADVLTVYPQSCPDLRGTLEEIRRLGVSPGVSVDLGYPLERVRDAVLGLAGRVVVMGTGVKGVGLEPEALERVREVVRWRGISGSPEIYVDGGIRRHTVPEIARAGADGVVPGSPVFGSESWEEAVRWVQSEDARGATR